MSICFLCLNKCTNKICPTCQCFAHPKCWGEYLQHNTDIVTYIYPTYIIISTPFNTECPQCRGDINTVKSTTRSETAFARKTAVISHYKNMLYQIELATNLEERNKLLKDTCEYFQEQKNLIRADEELTKILQEKLVQLFINYKWNDANIYYLNMFGQQLVQTELYKNIISNSVDIL